MREGVTSSLVAHLRSIFTNMIVNRATCVTVVLAALAVRTSSNSRCHIEYTQCDLQPLCEVQPSMFKQADQTWHLALANRKMLFI